MLVEVFVCIVILILLYQRWAKRDIYKLGKRLNSGVMSLPFLGHSYLFLGDNQKRMKAFQILGHDAIRKENGLTSFWLGNYLYTMIAEPESAELVLKTCLEKDDIMKMATLFLGKASIFAPVSIWRPRRKILSSCFSMKNLKNFMSIFVQQSDVLVGQMMKVAGIGPFTSWKYFTAYTMDAIAESTLGYKMGAQKNPNHPFIQAFGVALEKCAERVCQPWLHNDLVYTNLPVYQKLLESKKYLWVFFNELIKTKRKELEGDTAIEEHKLSSEDRLKTFLELLITLSGGLDGYTDMEVLEESLMIMVAGNDTSAVGTAFISVMLSRYPEVQEKVYEELQEVFGDSDRPVTFEDLARLKYLDAVVKETLRLYPPVPVITRKVQKDVVLPSGIKLVPGTGVVVNIWALHRNPAYWGDDAELFRPERFFDTPLKHLTAFMPFSHGPRNCVGYQYAMMSMKTAVSSLLRQFKILPASAPNANSEYTSLRLRFDLMMKDEDEFQIQIQSR